LIRLAKNLLEIKNLRTYFYTYAGVVKALEGVNITIREKDIFGIVGETGCGKSVTALSILRLVPNPGRIIGGEILFKDENLLKLSENEMRTRIRGKEISATFQDPATYLAPSHSIGIQMTDIIKANLDSKEDKKPDFVSRVIENLKMVQLPDPERIASQYPHELSGGMKQRAMIGMGASCKPSLFIADEASTFLDVTIGARILRLFVEMNRRDGTSLLIITHNLGIIGKVCNRVAVMYAGQVAEMCTVKSLFDNPLHPYTIGLLEAIPRLDLNVDRLKEIPGSIPNLIHPPSGCRFNPRCSRSIEVCRREVPKMIEVEQEHFVSCHIFDSDTYE